VCGSCLSPGGIFDVRHTSSHFEATLEGIARSYGVSHPTIMRL
jgi:hypothetical protein